MFAILIVLTLASSNLIQDLIKEDGSSLIFFFVRGNADTLMRLLTYASSNRPHVANVEL